MNGFFVFIITLLVWMGTLDKSQAQTPVEMLVGDKYSNYISYWQKDLDTAGRFNFFSLTNFTVGHRDSQYNSISADGQFSYGVNQWLGISVGGAFDGSSFVPSAGLSLSYASRKGNLAVEMYPVVQLSDALAFDWFGVVLYTPRFSARWGLFSQLIFTTNLQLSRTNEYPTRTILGMFTRHTESRQLVRIGLDLNQTFQFGIGGDFAQFGASEGTLNNIGVFVRLQFK